MKDLERTMPMKLPAVVVDARPVLIMRVPYHRKADLIADVTRRSRRGQVRPIDPRPSYNERTGEWEQRVTPLYDPAPAWIRPAIIAGGILLLLALLIGLGWWMVASLASAPLALFLLAALGALVVIMRAGRGPTVRITQKVNVR